MHRCPKCQSIDLRVEVTMVATLVQYNGDEMLSPKPPASWNERSPMLCNSCDYTASARHFDTTESHLSGEED